MAVAGVILVVSGAFYLGTLSAHKGAATAPLKPAGRPRASDAQPTRSPTQDLAPQPAGPDAPSYNQPAPATQDPPAQQSATQPETDQPNAAVQDMDRRVGDYNASLKRLDQIADKYERTKRAELQQSAEEQQHGSYDDGGYLVALIKDATAASIELQNAASAMKQAYDAITTDPTLLQYYRPGAYLDNRHTLENFSLFADYTYYERL